VRFLATPLLRKFLPNIGRAIKLVDTRSPILAGCPPLFHPQQRAPLFPLPCDWCNPCLQRTVSRDVCARPFTLQVDSFSSCAPCVPCQKQRVSPGLLRAAPRLACARPRSGRSPLPSDCRATAPGATHACLRATSQRVTAPAECHSERPLGTCAPGATHVFSECSSGTPARDYISHVSSACSSGPPAHDVCMHPAHVRSYNGRSPLRCDKQRVLLRDARNYLFYVRSACSSGTPAHSGRSPLCMTTRGSIVCSPWTPA
jgi:hypothetical protein